MDRGQESTLPPHGHLPALTSLRFFAAAAVLLLHVGQKVPPFPGARDLFGLGHVGVTFFFILSGFVLAWTHRPGDTARRFYGRRFARVWPLHAAMTVLAAVVVLSLADQPRWWALPFVLTLTHAFVPGTYYAFNTPSWSLGCEAFFYALFPLLIVRARRTRRPVAWALATGGVAAIGAVTLVFVAAPLMEAAVGVSATGVVGYGLNIFPGYRVLEFGVGILLAVAVRRGWRSPVSLSVGVAVVAAAWLAVWGLAEVAGTGAADLAPYWASVALLGPLALLVVSAASSDLTGRPSVLHHPLLVRLGAASFALYLVHVMVFLVVQQRLDGAIPDWALAPVAVTVALVLAEVAHRGIEKPLEARLRARMGARQPRVEETAT